jgi:transposase
VDKTLPEIIVKTKEDNGVLMYQDEAGFRVSGTISRGWIRKGRKEGKEVDSEPTRESVKAFGAVTVSDKPKFHFLFAKVYNALTFLRFLKQLVRQYRNRKIRLILDNVKYHHAKIVTKWLEENKKRIELHFLPAYSPDLNAQEGVWRLTRRASTHNRHFKDYEELHKALFRRFNRFQGNPASLRGMIAPFNKVMAK